MPCLRWLPCRGEAAWAPLYGLTDTELAAHLAAVVRVIAQAQAVLLAAIREADSRGLLGSEDAAVVRAALDPLAVPLPTGPEGPAPPHPPSTPGGCVGGGLPVPPDLRGATRPWWGAVSGDRHPPLGTPPTRHRHPRHQGTPHPAARRLACDAQLLPAVLGGAGQVLDVGRVRRLITGPLRRALILRDRGVRSPPVIGRWSGTRPTTSPTGLTGPYQPGQRRPAVPVPSPGDPLRPLADQTRTRPASRIHSPGLG